MALRAKAASVGRDFASRSPSYISPSDPSGGTQMEAGDLAAVSFTTGPHPADYTLESVTAPLGQVSGDADLVLTLYDMADDTSLWPGTSGAS